MDLYAYSQIDKYQKILEDNKIEIMRLRGIRLMKDEELVTEDNIKECLENDNLCILVNWLQQHSDDFWSSEHADDDHEAFIWDEKHENVIDYDFKKVHGADRKAIKYRWAKNEKAVRKQFELFNKYVGQNVLYVHARQGGGNRKWCPIDTKHPMYLADVDDAFDATYCDIYYDLDKAVTSNE